jgi:hypothetical protein
MMFMLYITLCTNGVCTESTNGKALEEWECLAIAYQTKQRLTRLGQEHSVECRHINNTRLAIHD